jgi:hypothetical protein
VALIASSFGMYLAYPVILLLPIGPWAKGIVIVGASVLSWAVFFGGTLLAGREGLAYLKGRLAAWRIPPHDRGGV